MKKQISSIIFLFFIWGLTVNAQNEPNEKLSISFGGGFSFPVGSYADKDAEQSAVFYNDDYPLFVGFDKSKSGFAKTGYYYNLELKYRVIKSWNLILQAGNFVNSVDDGAISDYINYSIFDGYYKNRTVVTNHSDYDTRYLMAGFRYTISCMGLVTEAAVLGGYATTNYPSYRIYFGSDGSYYGDFRTYPDPNAFMLEFSGSAKYVFSFNMFVGAEITYLQAGFDYTVENGNHPGGSISYAFDDTLNVRMLNAGLKIGYQFR